MPAVEGASTPARKTPCLAGWFVDGDSGTSQCCQARWPQRETQCVDIDTRTDLLRDAATAPAKGVADGSLLHQLQCRHNTRLMRVASGVSEASGASTRNGTQGSSSHESLEPHVTLWGPPWAEPLQRAPPHPMMKSSSVGATTGRTPVVLTALGSLARCQAGPGPFHPATMACVVCHSRAWWHCQVVRCLCPSANA